MSCSLFQRLCFCRPLSCLMCACVFLWSLLLPATGLRVREPSSDPSLSFHISISFFVLSSPQVAAFVCVCVCVCVCHSQGTVPYISASVPLSLTPAGFRVYNQSDEPLVCPLADMKTVRARKDMMKKALYLCG